MDTEISWYCLPVTVTIRKCSLVYSRSSIALVAEYYGFSLVIGIRKCGIEFAIRSESRVVQLVVYSSFVDRPLGVARGSASSSSLCPFARLFSRCSSAGGGHSACLIDRPRRRRGGSRDRPSIFLLRATQQGTQRLVHRDYHLRTPRFSAFCLTANLSCVRTARAKEGNQDRITRRSLFLSTILVPFRRRSRENRNTGAD